MTVFIRDIKLPALKPALLPPRRAYIRSLLIKTFTEIVLKSDPYDTET